MKKTAFILVCALLAGCSGNVKRTEGDLLKTDPYEFLAERLFAAAGRLPNRKVAILPFSYADKQQSEDGVTVSERLLTRMSQEGKLEVVERTLLAKVMSDLKLQYSSGVNEASIKSLGRSLGVDAVVTGTLTRRQDGTVEINARMISVDSAVVLAAASVTVPSDWENSRPVPEPVPAQGTVQAEAAPAPPSPPENFPQDWKYRDNFRVAEKSGAPLTDYQVGLVFDSSLPIKLGRMKPDCSDLRFANSNGTSGLNYWIQDGCGTSRTRVWLRLPFLAKNSVKNIYMYYGDPAARAASSGDKTFIFFDDFYGSGLDRGKWSVLQGACPVVQASGRLEFTAAGTGSSVHQTTLLPSGTFTPPYTVEFDAFAQDAGSNGITHEVHLRWDGTVCEPYATPRSAIGVVFLDGFSSNCFSAGCVGGSAEINPWIDGGMSFDTHSKDRPLTPGVWRHYRILDDGTSISAYWDDKELVSLKTALSTGSRLGFSAREYPNGAKSYYDNIFVRRLAASEPEVYLYRKSQSGRIL